MNSPGFEEKTDANGKIFRYWTKSQADGRIANFWEAIREKKIAAKDYDFSGYVFPKFEWYSRDNIETKERTENGKTIEMKYATKAANFWIRGWEMVFLGRADFESATFSGEVSFWSATFSGRADFLSAAFSGEVSFWSAAFSGKASFGFAAFSGEANFEKTRFSEQFQTLFEATDFRFPGSKEKRQNYSVNFTNVLFPSQVIFRRCDLSCADFTNANVENARFDECDFGKLRSRHGKKNGVTLFERSEPRKVLWEAICARKNNAASSKDFENIETRYRQFKKNFEEKRDWESAGDFYHWEMLMRLLKYGAERAEQVKKLHWWNPLWIWYGLFYNRGKTFFLRWYKWISDFNESPVRAMWWLFGSVLVSSGIFLLLFYSQPVGYEWERAFSFGFTGAIPIYSLPQDVENDLFAGKEGGLVVKWIYDGEIFFSTIVWALLILSIRQKFRR